MDHKTTETTLSVTSPTDSPLTPQTANSGHPQYLQTIESMTETQ